MSAYSHSKQVYNVPRPLTPDQLTIRPRRKPDRAVETLADYDSAELSHYICAVVSMGYAISFSATSDGGAVSISAYDGYTRFKCYGRHPDQLETGLRDLLAAVRGEA